MSKDLPLSDFIITRCRELGFRKIDLIARTDYKNQPKGLRRLDALLDGDLDVSKPLLDSLPRALNVPEPDFATIVESTRLVLEEKKRRTEVAAEAHWRAKFTPHAIIMTEEDRPSSIWLAVLIGVERILRVDFEGCEVSTFLDQALKGLARRLREFSDDPFPQNLPTFGKAVGVVINYSPDYAVWHDLDGEILRSRPRAYRIGEAVLKVGKHVISRSML